MVALGLAATEVPTPCPVELPVRLPDWVSSLLIIRESICFVVTVKKKNLELQEHQLGRSSPRPQPEQV
jgi:hypothetical protein